MNYLSVVLVVVFVAIATILWLATTACELSRKRNELILADKQLAIYSQRCTKVLGSPEAQLATEQVGLSREIYHNVATEYNHYIAKIANRPIAWLLGYHSVSEDIDK